MNITIPTVKLQVNFNNFRRLIALDINQTILVKQNTPIAVDAMECANSPEVHRFGSKRLIQFVVIEFNQPKIENTVIGTAVVSDANHCHTYEVRFVHYKKTGELIIFPSK